MNIYSNSKISTANDKFSVFENKSFLCNISLIRTLVLIMGITFVSTTLKAQYVPLVGTSGTSGIVSWVTTGGSYQSYGCGQIDPTFWANNSGDGVTWTFSTPVCNPIIRVWGMNTTDFANIIVNGVAYPLTAASASYNTKVVCTSAPGPSPGPDGVIFVSGQLTGANTDVQANYSYQDVQILACNVTTLKIVTSSAKGYGIDGVGYTTTCNAGTTVPALIIH